MHISEPLLKCSDGFDLVVEHQPQKKSSDQVAADVSYSFDFSTNLKHLPKNEQENIPKEEGNSKDEETELQNLAKVTRYYHL